MSKIFPDPFINLQLSNELTYVELEDKSPVDETINAYVDLFVRALIGLTFCEGSIRKGFENWLAENPTKAEDVCDY